VRVSGSDPDGLTTRAMDWAPSDASRTSEERAIGKNPGVRFGNQSWKGRQMPHEIPDECDLVMKGGITSGVVYPGAVEDLSARFTFRNIGGTSAGALVAVLTAAAEYQRRATGSTAGFHRLRDLTSELANTSGGRTKLETLFEPDPPTRKLFRAAVRLTQPSGSLKRAWRLSRVWRRIRKDADAVRANFYGIVSGHREGPDEGIADWLARLIEELAGRNAGGRALTFADLWGATSEAHAKQLHSHPWDRSINLELLATCLTLGSQAHLPLVRVPRRPNRADGWMFSREDMERILPKWVVESWVADAPEVATAHGASLHLIFPWRMPIVIAARMSMSFPGLFSAVPLYLRNFHAGSKGPPQRCWFSDGGITSNFPIDLFDAPLPSRPSFGFNVQPAPEGTEDSPIRSQRVLLNGNRGGPPLESWHRIPEGGGIESLLGFARRVFDTMQNWSDSGQAMIPGYRDRIITVLLDKGEGGMNVSMRPEVIATLDKRGRDAAAQLIEAYTTTRHAGQALTWDAHRWVRLRTTLQVVQDELRAMQRGAETGRARPPGVARPESASAKLMERIGCAPPTKPALPISEGDTRAALMLLDGLVALAREPRADLGESAPKPKPGHRTWLRL
jgi:predicted acylesterase/phospholipase RssA